MLVINLGIGLAIILFMLIDSIFVALSLLRLGRYVGQAPPGVLPPHAIRRCIVLTLSGALLLTVMHTFPPEVYKTTPMTFVTTFLEGMLLWGAFLGRLSGVSREGAWEVSRRARTGACWVRNLSEQCRRNASSSASSYVRQL